MPYQPMDYSRYFQVARQDPDEGRFGAEELLGGLERGMKLGSMPGRLMREREAAEIANKIKGVEAKYAEPHALAELNKKRADAIYKQLEAEYYPKSTEADIAYKKASMKNMGKTELMKNAWEASGGDPNKYRQYLQEGIERKIQGVPPYVEKLLKARDQALENGDTERAEILNDTIKQQSGQGVPAAVRTSQQNRELAGAAFDVGKNYMPPEKYFGLNSSGKIVKAIGEYETTKNPEKKRKLEEDIVKIGVYLKSMPEQTIQALRRQGVNSPTFHEIEKMDKQMRKGLPKFDNAIFGNLSPELTRKIELGHHKYITDVSKAENKLYKNRFRQEPEEVAAEYLSGPSRMTGNMSNEELMAIAGGQE